MYYGFNLNNETPAVVTFNSPLNYFIFSLSLLNVNTPDTTLPSPKRLTYSIQTDTHLIVIYIFPINKMKFVRHWHYVQTIITIITTYLIILLGIIRIHTTAHTTIYSHCAYRYIVLEGVTCKNHWKNINLKYYWEETRQVP